MEKSPKPPRRTVVGKRRRKVTVNGTARLLDAARRNDSKEVKELLQVKMYVGITQEDVNVALLMCCRNSCLESTQVLLENNAYYDFQDEDQWTPLHLAASCDNLKMVQLLLEHKADPTLLDVDGNFPVDLTHDTATKSLLMKHMAQHGVYEEDFHSARSRLARAMLVTIRNMIGKGKSINVLNKNGVSPLHTAAAFGYYEVGRQLLEAGALVDMRDELGHTPLFVAAKFNQREMAQLLISHGADKTAVREPKLAEFVRKAVSDLGRASENSQMGQSSGQYYLHQQTISNIWKLTSITKVDMGRERDALLASRQAPVQCMSLKESAGLVDAYKNPEAELIYDDCLTVEGDGDEGGGGGGNPLLNKTVPPTISLPCRFTYEEEDYDSPSAPPSATTSMSRHRSAPVIFGEQRKPAMKPNYSHSKIILVEPAQQPASPSTKKHTYVNVPDSSEVYVEEEVYDDTATSVVRNTSGIHFQSSLEVEEIYDDASVAAPAKGTIVFQPSALENEIYDDAMSFQDADRKQSHSSPQGEEEVYDDTIFFPNVVKMNCHTSSPENNETYDDTVSMQSSIREHPVVKPVMPRPKAFPYEEVKLGPTDIDYAEIDDEPPAQTQAITYSKGRKKLSQRRSLPPGCARNGLNRSPPMARAQIAEANSHHPQSVQPREHKPLTKSQSADMKNRPLPTLPSSTGSPAAVPPAWRSRMFPPSPVKPVPSGLQRRDSTPNKLPPPVPRHRRVSPPNQPTRRSLANSRRPHSVSAPSLHDSCNNRLPPSPITPSPNLHSESFPMFTTIVEDTEPSQAPPAPPRHRKPPKSPEVTPTQKKSDWGHLAATSYPESNSVTGNIELDSDQELSPPSGLLAEIQKVKLKKSSGPPSPPPPSVSPRPAVGKGDFQGNLASQVQKKKLQRVSVTPTCLAPANGHVPRNLITGNDSNRILRSPVPPPKPAKLPRAVRN